MHQPQDPVTISIRTNVRQRELIDQAAESLGRSPSNFVLEASCRRAEEVLVEQTGFVFDADQMGQFQALIENPPSPNEQLQRLLDAPLPWEQPG